MISKNVLAAAVMLALLFGVFLAGKYSRQKEVHSYENIIRAKDAEVKIWKDETSNWRILTESAEITSKEALKYLASTDVRFKNLSDEFTGVKKNLKNLEAASFGSSSSVYNITNIQTKDTVIGSQAAKSFVYVDSAGWFSAYGLVMPDGKIPNLKFESRDSLVTVITKKRRFLRRPVYFQEIKSYNPHNQITYSSSVIVNR
jgi:hypothetical protein